MKKITVTRQSKYTFGLIAILATVASSLEFAMYYELQTRLSPLLGFVLVAVVSWCMFIRDIHKGNILLDNEGLKEGGKTILTWGEVEGIHKKGWCSIHLLLKDGSIKKVNLFDVNRASRNNIFLFITEMLEHRKKSN